MDPSTLVMVLVALLVGVTIGALAVTAYHRSRGAAADAEDGRADDRAATEVAQARSEAAQAREQFERIRADLAEARGHIAEARSDAAEANAARSDISATIASLRAELTGARQQLTDANERAARIAEDRETLANQFKVLSESTLEHQGRKADASAELRLRATEQLMAPVAETLQHLQKRLTTVETERAALAAELRGQVHQVQLTGEALRRETHALATALRKPQVRGAWGELQLTRVAEIAGMTDRCDFDLQQTTVTAGEATIRPDMRVNLGEGKYVWVDAKVPLASFLDAHETDDDAVRDQALHAFGRTVRSHIDQLSGKQYWTSGGATPEFVVLFLPSEALLVEAVGRLPDLHEYATHRNIVLATPTTLIAMLRAVAYGWKQAALAESAAEVFELGRELYNRLGRMGGHVDKLGRSLQAAVNAYNQTLGSLETRVMVTARKMADLQVTDADLPLSDKLDQPVRQLTADELVEDATRTTPMIGRRSSRRTGGLPEADELVRGEPDLFDDVEPPTRERRSS